MFLQFGKHFGKSLEFLVLKEPGYVLWMLGEQSPTARLIEAEARRLIQLFDDKPLLVECQAADCHNPATRGSVHRRAVGLCWWCDECDPSQLGASPSKLTIVRSYWDALRHVSDFRGGHNQAMKSLIKSLAQVKGLPARVGAEQAVAFFLCVFRLLGSSSSGCVAQE